MPRLVSHKSTAKSRAASGSVEVLNLIEQLERLELPKPSVEPRDKPRPSTERILTVSELNGYVQRSLAGDPMLQSLKLRGEISNFKRHSSGHLYFTLKDESSRISCVMFRSAAQLCDIAASDGLAVIARGKAALYAKDGTYQFYVEDMRLDGVGSLFQRYEQLRRRLLSEGLFDAARKVPLPLLPRAVGIVTSRTGAVIHDIMTVAARRHPGIPLYLVPVKVQGEGAASEIVRGIRLLESLAYIDVIIIGRGGGSLEDLWAFNEEEVVRAVASCIKPIVSAVGHETDTTLSDFAADVRAATPSAAAEITIPSRDALIDQIGQYRIRLLRSVDRSISRQRERLMTLAARLNAVEPGRMLSERLRRVSLIIARLNSYAANLVPIRRVRLEGLVGRLHALNPENVMERGYSMVYDKRGRLLTKAIDVAPNILIDIRMRDGRVEAMTCASYLEEAANGASS